MKLSKLLIIGGSLTLGPLIHGATVTVTTEAPTGAGSLTAAIHSLNDGDKIAFNIPPAAGEVHYIQVPLDGFPLITNNNITIDGYTQNGASPNTSALHAANNASLRIVLTATNGHGLSMHTACVNAFGGTDIPRLGYDDTEIAILGFFHATNAVVQGLVFQANPFATNTLAAAEADPSDGPFLKAICFAANSPENGGDNCQNFRVSGCWFGVNPVTKQVAFTTESVYGLGTVVASPAICVASYRTRNAATDDVVFNHPGTLGVAVGSANPKAEFNVWVTGYGFDSEGLDYRFSGNFFGVLPDGVTSADMGVLSALQQSDGFIEIGRRDSNITVGTDGDGVNDDQEGNIFGPMTVGGTCINFYGITPGTNIVIAGNYFGLDINGKPFTAEQNANPLMDEMGSQSTVRFGSDMNGVSDAFEGNSVTNARLIAYSAPGTPGTTAWLSMRRNTLLNTTSASGSRPPLGDGSATGEGQEVYSGFIDITAGAGEITPVINGTTTTTTLSGKCGSPAAGSSFTNLMVDLYEADGTAGAQPQGKRWIASFKDNSPADGNATVGTFSFSTAGLGLTSGTKITIAVTYSSDTVPTISSISRSGDQTTLNVTGGTASGPTLVYGVQQSTTLGGPYTFIAAAVNGAASFVDTSSTAFYRATGPAATGQTAPFSDVYTLP